MRSPHSKHTTHGQTQTACIVSRKREREREREVKRHTLFGYHMREALREEERGQGKKDRRERALQKLVGIPILCGIEVTHLFPTGG